MIVTEIPSGVTLNEKVKLRILAWALAICLVASVAPAQTREPVDIDNLYHWAYGAAFGTGAYRIGGDRVFVVRATPKFELGTFAEDAATLILKLPVTVGVEDLDLGDFDLDDVDEYLRTISFVPGLDLPWQASDRWQLQPFGHYGWGTEMGGSESAQIYFVGINSRFTFTLNDSEVDLLNGLQWLGHRPNAGSKDRFTRLVTGLEAKLALPGVTLQGHPALLRPHIAHFWYFEDLSFRQLEQSPVELKQEFEFGLALGAEEALSFGFLKFDRIGLAYRVGDGFRGIRLCLGPVLD